MFFRQFFDSTSGTYSYLLADKNTSEAVFIDPVREKTESYLTFISELKLHLIATLDTHTHADHITGSSELSVKTGCRIIIGKDSLAQGASDIISDGEFIRFGQHQLQAIATPGHTIDSYCFYFEENGQRSVFTGDTLLIRSTGRTDFQQGDAAAQYHSLFHKLLLLPENTTVYPGHDYKGWTVSTIGEEKKHNPRLQVSCEEEYKRMMDNLNLPEPEMIHIAVPANLQCGFVR